MPATTHSAQLTLPSDTEISIIREFDAPRHLVYKAWTTPELVKRWWSGKRGKVTVAEIDLRVGGMYRYVLVTSEGHEVAFHGEFREIVPNERLVNTEVFEMPGAPPLAPEDEPVNVMTFEEHDGRTTLTVLTRCASKGLRDAIIDSGMEGGMQESLDALEEVAISLRT